MSIPRRQLIAFTFPPGSSFEGQLVGALERIESGGTMRILDALFVGREAGSGELSVASLSADGQAGAIGRLLSFRLDESARRRASERLLAGPVGDWARSLAEDLEPGSSVAAVLIEHSWERVLHDAVGRIGGIAQVDSFVESDQLADHLEKIGGAAAPEADPDAG